MRLILIGAPASGKTTIGQSLSQTLQCQFIDTDQIVEHQAKQSISQIFAEQGEAAFRELEIKALQAALQSDSAVISTGGGIIKHSENRALLQQEPHVIYLDVAVVTQLNRTQGDTLRPLLQGADKQEILQRLREERDPLYREVAKQVIDANQTVEAIVSKIRAVL